MPNWKKLVLYNSDASLNTLNTNAVTGSLLGTASYALNTLTASYVGGVVDSASFASTSSYYKETDPIFTAVSGTFATTGSNIFIGNQTITGSLSQGSGSAALGVFSHAEGWYTTASGVASHAEGFTTATSGNYSHTEGDRTKASGLFSHAEGSLTLAVGSASHTEGRLTSASGLYSHAEGQNTQAVGQSSHAEGQSTTAAENYSHAEGFSTISSGSYSHAEGYATIASGYSSHAEGRFTKAIGQYSHAEGLSTSSSGDYSHAEGRTTVALGNYSHAEGWQTVALGDNQHVQGQYNQSSSIQSAFIVGNGSSDINRSNLIFAAGNTVQVTGSIEATQGFTGSLQGTASYFSETDPVFVSMSGSFATTGSNTFTGNQTINGTILTDGTITFSNSAFISNTAISGSTYISTLNAGILHLNDDGGEGDIIMLNGQGNKVRTRGNVEVTGSLKVTGGITGSLLGTASNATSSSYSDTSVSASYASSSSRSDNSTSASYSNNSTTASFANTASYVNPLQQNVTVVGNLNIAGNITAQQYIVSTSVYYVTESFSSGSHIFGNSLDDTHQFTGSVLITGSLTADSITGTLVGTASNATTALFAQTASYVENAQTASHIQGGKATHIPYFIEDTRLATSSIFQSGSASIIINQDNNTTANPEALYVWQPNTSSINVISGKGNLDNYLQLNIQNTNQGGNASSDIVATANNGNESDNYIDMGINSENFSGFLGGPNDSYVYSHGQNMWLGNINDGHNLYLFNSSSEEPVLTITSDNNVEIADRLYVSGSITGSLFGTASQAQHATSASYALTASYALNVPATASFAVSSSYALSASFAANSTHATNADTAVSASHAVNADTAINANYATTAGNGGVTNIVAGSGISLLPTGGTGAVTVIATGVGGVTIISGSNITGSFTNSDTWVFNHNLGVRTPIITVFDSQYNQIIPQNIQLTDTGSATITFPTQESGFVVASLGGATGTVLSSSYALQSTYSTTASYYSETDPIFVSKSGSYATTGSNRFIGNQIITGSLTVSGSSTFTNIGPAVFNGSTTVTGSLNLSGSFNVIGNQTTIGNRVLTGSWNVSGSSTQIGNSTLVGNTVLSGSIEIVGVEPNRIVGKTVISGSLDVSGSSNFHNSEFTVTGSTYIKGFTNISGSTNITGSLNVVDGNINVVSGSSFTRWGNKLFNYGVFSSTVTQSGSADTILSMSFNSTDVGGAGVSIVSGSRITVENTGVYNLQFSSQFDRVATGTDVVTVWFAYTGSSLVNSATDIILTGNAASNPIVASWNYVLPMSASSYVQIYWSTPDDRVEMSAKPIRTAPARPAVPSVIATLTQIA